MIRYASRTASRFFLQAFAALIFAVPAFATPTSTNAPPQDELWRKSLELAAKGDFKGAHDTIALLQPRAGTVTEKVREWLNEYQSKQAARRDLDKADFEKYVGYSKARIERKEYDKALDWAIFAADVSGNKEAMLQTDWMRNLVNLSLEHATELRKKRDWKGAWYIYADLGNLYDREPRYQKLEHEVLSQLRYEQMFKIEEGKPENLWAERINRVQWKDAEAALECIGLYYVEPADFKAITERGLEQLLLLAESEAAQKNPALRGLQDEDNRRDFVARVKERLDQVRAAGNVDRQEAVRHFRRVVQQINKETVRLPDELVISELMRGALEPLDDFTTMIWPEDTDEFDKHTRGDFIGVGISIIKNKSEEIEVVTPLEDTPAFRQGILPKDIITAVDGKDISKLSLNKVVDTITGPKGSKVTLTVRRGEQLIEFPLVREKVKIQSVKGWDRKPDGTWDFWKDKENGIGYVRLTNFQRNTVEDLDHAMSELQAQGLKGLILDLRGNPGGLLDSAWQVSSRFLSDGSPVVSTKGRNRAEDQVLEAPGEGPYSNIPMVVLVDQASASASEIVSGALRDDGRATVIGERTFGKFSVQNLIPLSSSNAKLKITTARYYLPSGVSLHREPTSEKWGVEPQIVVPISRWERFNTYQLRRQADLLGAAKTDETQAAADKKKDEEEEKLEVDPLTGDVVTKKETEAEGLPPLEQPDENNRPKEDPQIDTALLVMRLKLLADRFPTIAAAERAELPKSAQP